MTPPRTQFPIAIVGGGFGGVAAALFLRRAGFRDVVIFERSAGVGGTWWDNRYPGVATDAASHLYSYSFAAHDWPRTHVGQALLQDYVARVIRRFDLTSALRLRTAVVGVAWDETSREWIVTPEGGEPERFRAVVSAVGLFSKPRWPDLPGLEGFAGTLVHSALWPEGGVDLAGKRVAVVGVGSSAAQVVPAILSDVASLTLFQRQPGWLLPKRDRDFTRRERLALRFAPIRRTYRLKLYLDQERREWGGAFFKPGSRSNQKAKAAALAYLDEVFHDRPDLRAALTPDYDFAGKRTVVSSDFYPALCDPKVRVVPRAVQAATASGLVDEAGEAHEVDVVILCTGFEATAYLASLPVVGRGGQSLQEVWAGEPQAFAGLMVPGFPNFFMMYGPNTNGGLIITNFQHQARFITRELSRLRNKGLAAVEVTTEATRRYNDWLQRRMTGTAFETGLNYFKTASGRIVTQWPDSATEYALRLNWISRVWRWRREDAARPAAASTNVPPMPGSARPVE